MPALRSIAERCWLHVRDGCRQLRARPGFTAIAVASLALGIGVNTAMFTVVHAVLLAPLPYPHADRLVALGRIGSTQVAVGDVTDGEYTFWHAQSRSLQAVAGYQGTGERRLTWNGEHDWRPTLAVTADFLRTLEVRPALGRPFDAREMAANGPPAAIISDPFWRSFFGADPSVVGRTVLINDEPHTIVGVLPRGFWFHLPFDVLRPLPPAEGLDAKGTNTSLVARLREDVTLAQAQAEMRTLSEAFRREPGAEPAADYRGVTAVPFREIVSGPVRQNLLLLFGATALLLLLACANLITLLLTRFAARERELAVRVALGGSRATLVAGFFVEQALMTLLGAAVALAAGTALLRLLAVWMPWTLPTPRPLALDPAVLAFTLGVAILAALLFTLVPLMTLRRLNPSATLQASGRASGGRGSARTRHVLVVLEVAMSTVLLIGASLLIQSLYRLHQESLGFAAEGRVTFETPLDVRRRQLPQRLAFTAAMFDQLRAIPGVQRVAAINMLPLAGRMNLPVQRDGVPEQSIGAMEIRAVTPEYFAVMGIPLRAGRAFDDRDRAEAPPVVIVNETVARAWWPEGGAVNDRVLLGRYKGRAYSDGPACTVVGVVADTKTTSLQRAPSPTIFMPVAQELPTAALTWVLQVQAAPGLAADIRQAVARIDPAQRVQRLRSIGEVVAATMATPRFNASLFGLFATTGLVLAVMGLSGVIAFLVSRRTQEIGTRIALGAARGDVLRIFLRQGLALTLTGLAIGLAGAYATVRSLSGLLFGVQPLDPASFLAVAIFLLLVGLIATLVPAWRAAAIDPLMALRRD